MDGYQKLSFLQNSQKGIGDFPNLRSRQIAKRNISEKDFSVYLKPRFPISAVKGAAFVQYFRVAKILFCTPDSARAKQVLRNKYPFCL